jgi:hypothetical protein
MENEKVYGGGDELRMYDTYVREREFSDLLFGS